MFHLYGRNRFFHSANIREFIIFYLVWNSIVWNSICLLPSFHFVPLVKRQNFQHLWKIYLHLLQSLIQEPTSLPGNCGLSLKIALHLLQSLIQEPTSLPGNCSLSRHVVSQKMLTIMTICMLNENPIWIINLVVKIVKIKHIISALQCEQIIDPSYTAPCLTNNRSLLYSTLLDK